jgi:hypothetical protein
MTDSASIMRREAIFQPWLFFCRIYVPDARLNSEPSFL